MANLAGGTVSPGLRGRRRDHGESAVACADFHGVSPTPHVALANAPHSPATTATPLWGEAASPAPRPAAPSPSPPAPASSSCSPWRNAANHHAPTAHRPLPPPDASSPTGP